MVIACVVEGHGERESVPILVRRVAALVDPGLPVSVATPIRQPKSRLLKPGELERAVDLAARNAGRSGAVLVLVDGDDDCPAEHGPALLMRAVSARNDVAVSVVLAKRELESWFLAAAESLRGHRGLPADLQAPPNPEGIAGAKEWLSRHMESGAYSPTLDQPALAATMDLALARRADSFDKCYREIVRLIEAGRALANGVR